jgi:hypothetical protein
LLGALLCPWFRPVGRASRNFGMAGRWAAEPVAKRHRGHLHLTPARLELLGSNIGFIGRLHGWPPASTTKEQAMKKTILLAAITVSFVGLGGCNSCRPTTGSWFNRGDRCNVAPPGCPPGMPQATMMLPTSPQVLPGPIEIAPMQ